MPKHKVSLLLIEDNLVYCDLLLRELKSRIQQSSIKSKFAFNVFSFNNPKDCISMIKKTEFNDTIAFIDYYLGEAINGAHIFKLLREQNKNLSVIMMSNSTSIKDKMENYINDNLHLHFLVKDQYTPAACAMLLELYLQDLQ